MAGGGEGIFQTAVGAGGGGDAVGIFIAGVVAVSTAMLAFAGVIQIPEMGASGLCIAALIAMLLTILNINLCIRMRADIAAVCSSTLSSILIPLMIQRGMTNVALFVRAFAIDRPAMTCGAQGIHTDCAVSITSAMSFKRFMGTYYCFDS